MFRYGRTAILLISLMILLSSPALGLDPPEWIAAWGEFGTAPGSMDGPAAIASDGSSLYVLDWRLNVVHRFSRDGQYLDRWGRTGVQPGELNGALGLMVAPDGNLIVADTYSSRLQRLAPDGTFILTWGSFGDAPGQFKQVLGVAAAPDGTVYATDRFNRRVQRFDADGALLAAWGTRGTGPGEFEFAANAGGIVVNRAGDVYVADSGNDRVQKFTADGVHLLSWGSSGDGPGQFARPSALAVDGQGNVYVADTRNHRVQVFDAQGNYLLEFGGEGTENGRFQRPSGLLIDGGRLYVADTWNHRVQTYGISREILARFPSTVNPGAGGVIPATLLAGEGFSAGDIDVASLRLNESAQAVHAIAVPAAGHVNGYDLKVKFSAPAPPATQAGSGFFELRVTGSTHDGQAFFATARVKATLNAAAAAGVGRAGNGQIAFTQEAGGMVRVQVFDVAGRLVEELHRGRLGPGTHRFTLSRQVGIGIYFYRISAGDTVYRGKITRAG